MHNLLERAGGHYVDVTSGETKKQHPNPRRNRHPPRRNMGRRAEGEISGMWNGKRMQRIFSRAVAAYLEGRVTLVAAIMRNPSQGRATRV
jgi:hypothetical protein